MFVFGSQYLRGTTPERDQWLRDMENMKNLGFNTIRAWMVWNCIERRQGEIDYDYISSFLDSAAQFDLQVGLLFHLHACPHWAVDKFSKYFYVSEDQLPFEPAVRPNTPSGGWPGLCFDNEEVREMESNFITAVMNETKKHNNVAFYEPMNEPHQWVDLTKNPVGIFCYCPATMEKFRQWLKDKYGDIEGLNNAWGYAYSDFSQVRPPRWTSSFSDYIDFRLFTMDNVAQEISFRSDIIRSNDNKPVIAHAWGGGAVTCSQLGGMAFDDWKNAQIFDKWGYSAFPSSDKDCCVLGLGCDATRGAAGGKEFWQSELSAGIVGGILNHNGRISDDTFDKFSLESIRHGAKGLLYWQYRKERIGAEMGGFAMTDYDGGPTNLSIRAGKLGEFLSKYGEVLENGTSAPAEVALVFSIRSYLADWASRGKAHNAYSIHSMTGYYRMFWDENIPVDVIHESFPGDLNKYKMIILPSAFAIEPSFAEKLREYIENGGTVLSEHSFGMFTETFKMSYQVPGCGFAEIFGVHEDDLRQRAELTISNENESFYIKGNRFAETFRDNVGEALYSYEDGSPAIILNKYGKGQAVISGINLGLPYSNGKTLGDDFADTEKESSSTTKEIVLKLCQMVGVKQNICTADDVKVTVVQHEDDVIVILINSVDCMRSGSVNVPFECSVSETVYGVCEHNIQKNILEFTLDSCKSAVIRLKK